MRRDELDLDRDDWRWIEPEDDDDSGPNIGLLLAFLLCLLAWGAIAAVVYLALVR